MKPIEKAAILLKSIGEENLENILKYMKAEVAARLKGAIQDISEIPPETRKEVIRELLRKASEPSGLMKPSISPPEPKYSKFVEEEPEEEEEEIDLLGFLQRADHKQLIDLIKNEHPQAIAFILSYMPSEVSGQILPLLSNEQQKDVAFRIATMGLPQKEMIKHLNTMLGNKIKHLTSKQMQVGGVESLVKILKGAGRNSERIILEHFQKEKPDLAYDIKNMMLVFEDLVLLDNMSVQKILRDIDTKVLARALKKTTPEIKELIMRNLSERARTILEEDITTLGMIPIREVEKAQQMIIEVVRTLEEKGEININKEQEELV